MKVWKDLKNFERIYQISSDGEIRTKSREILRNGNVITLKSRIRKQKFNKHTGYMMVELNLGKTKTFTIHSLMGETFLGYKRGQGRSGKSNCVNHKDGNKLNNKLSNLEVISLKENIVHAHKNGLSTSHKVKYNGIEYYSKSEMRRVLKMGERKQNKLIESGKIILI